MAGGNIPDAIAECKRTLKLIEHDLSRLNSSNNQAMVGAYKEYHNLISQIIRILKASVGPLDSNDSEPYKTKSIQRAELNEDSEEVDKATR